MDKKVFYSWQSDSPGAVNRNFILAALESAAKSIADDDDIDVEPVVDRDTKGVPGSPDIASTIFRKIDEADVFVADVSIISQDDGGRPTPNPNVLIELGYALRSLGHERIVLVFNEASGNIGDLPFDLRQRRVMAYTMEENTEEKAPERSRLQKQLEVAIVAALDSPATGDALEVAPDAAARRDAFNQWTSVHANKAREHIKVSGGIEVAHGLLLPGNGYAWSRDQLRDAARKAALPNTGWPMGLVVSATDGKPVPSDDGIAALLTEANPEDYWALRKSGDYYFFRRHDEDAEDEAKREFWFNIQIWRISEALLHTNALYTALGVDPDAEVVFEITYSDLLDRSLVGSPGSGRRLSLERKSSISQVTWRVEASVESFRADLKKHVQAMSSELFEVFDMAKVPEDVVEGLIDDFLKSPQ